MLLGNCWYFVLWSLKSIMKINKSGLLLRQFIQFTLQYQINWLVVNVELTASLFAVQIMAHSKFPDKLF